MLVYGFRFYDPSIARFTSIDPLTEEFHWQSGYVYADNDPVGKIDYMGLSGQKNDDWVQKENGFIYWDEDAVSKETTKEGETYLGKAYFHEYGNSGFGTMYYDDRSKEMIKTVSTITITPQKKGVNATVQNSLTSSSLAVSKADMHLSPKLRTKLKYHYFTRGEGFYKSLDRLGKVKTSIGYIDGKTAYFTKGTLTADGRTNMAGEPIKQPDIYSFELPVAARATPVTYVQATVKDGNSKKLLADANIELIELSSNTVISKSKTNAQGNFLTTLPLGNDYGLNVNKTAYLFHSENFSLSEQASLDKPYQLQIELYPIPKETTAALPEKAKPIILKNVFFESGSADLKIYFYC